MADRQQNLYGLLIKDPRRIFVIAEAGINDGGNKERALALVRAAKWTGADAVKFRAFKADRLPTRPAVLGHTKDQSSLEEPYKLELTPETFRAVHKESQRLDIEFIATPFDEESSDFLDELGVNAFKIAPRDIARRQLIDHVARKRKPVLLFTGMCSAEQIEKAIGWMRTQSNDQIVLLHCVSSNPAKMEELNLKSVQCLHGRFGLPVGFSDHSASILGSIVATSLGAQVIERHFTIESRADATDHMVSMDAKQLKLHIEELRTIGTMLGERSQFALETENSDNIASRRALRRPIPPSDTVSSGTGAKHRLAARASAAAQKK